MIREFFMISAIFILVYVCVFALQGVQTSVNASDCYNSKYSIVGSSGHWRNYNNCYESYNCNFNQIEGIHKECGLLGISCYESNEPVETVSCSQRCFNLVDGKECKDITLLGIRVF